MLDSKFLLTDEQMIQFITKGYLVLHNELPEQLHRTVMDKINEVFHEEGNPGNNILPRIPDIQRFFDTPVVRGALTSVLGPDYYMHPHRHCHYNKPGNQSPGEWHKDGFWCSIRSHRPWWAMIFYYTQDITEQLGPTAIMPGTQYYEKFLGDRGETVLPTGKAGTMVLVHFDMWHRASHNVSGLDRYMLKFQFVRLSAPEYPSWNHRDAHLKVPDGTPSVHLNLWRDVWSWLLGMQSPAIGNRVTDEEELQRLGQELRSGDASVRGRAADELGLIGEAAAVHAPALGQLLGDQAETAALNAAYALGHMGPSGTSELIGHLTAGKTIVADRAAYGLQASGTNAIPGLLEVLNHPEEKRAALAAFVLGMIGPHAAEAVPALVDKLRTGGEWVRRNAAEALGMIGKPGGLVVPALSEALVQSLLDEGGADARKPDNMYVVQQNYIVNKTGYTAALSLLRSGKGGDAKQVVDALEQAMSSRDRYVRAYAMEGLTHLRTEEAVEALIKYFRASRWCPDTNKASTF